jgi:hypothetical protein
MHRGRIHEANEWEKIVKLQKKEIKISHWTTYTEKEFMKQNEWKKIGKLEKKDSKTFQWTTYTEGEFMKQN